MTLPGSSVGASAEEAGETGGEEERRGEEAEGKL